MHVCKSSILLVLLILFFCSPCTVAAVPDTESPVIRGLPSQAPGPGGAIAPSSPILERPVGYTAPVNQPVVTSPVVSGGVRTSTPSSAGSSALTPGSQNITLNKTATRAYAPGEVIIKYRTDLVSTQNFAQTSRSANQGVGATVLKTPEILGVPGAQVVTLPADITVEDAVSYYDNLSYVEYAQPNYRYEALEAPPLIVQTPVRQDSSRTVVQSSGRPVIGETDVQMRPVLAYPADNTTQTPSSPSVMATTPNDPYYTSGTLWGLNKISCSQAWDFTQGSSSVKVAVLDTGVDGHPSSGHADLRANVDWANGYDFAYDDSVPNDVKKHGTHCAGTIAGVGNNGIGVAGVAWQTTILPVKVLGDTGSGWSDDIAAGIDYARNKGAHIISMSLGGFGYDQWMYDAIARSPNVLVICAAGNDGVNTDLSYNFVSPAGYNLPNIISVGASSSSDTRASFSNYGATSVDLFAPGVSIMSTVPGGGYESWQGTSMATPHVSGVAALIKAANPSYTMAQIRDTILTQVDTASGLSGLCVTGGRLNANKAVRSAVALEAKFYGVPGTQVYPLTVTFYDVSTGFPTSRLWEFSDGGSETIANPTHTFHTVGNNWARLTVYR